MKKWIVIGVGAAVVIIAVGLIFGISNLGPIIKQTVNAYGPRITKTELHVDDVDVSLFSAEVKIKKFFLGNPDGFKTADAMTVDAVFVNVDEGSLTGDTIVIDRIEVKSPQITYEKKARGDNLNTILRNVAGSAGPDKSAKKEANQKGAEKKLIIRNFIMQQGKVTLVLSAAGIGDKTIRVPLPDIHLKDIGREKNGASPAQVFNEILAAVYGKITSPGVTDALNRQLQTMGIDLDSIGNEVARQLEGGAGQVGKGLDGIGRTIKNFLDN